MTHTHTQHTRSTAGKFPWFQFRVSQRQYSLDLIEKGGEISLEPILARIKIDIIILLPLERMSILCCCNFDCSPVVVWS
jgi:hypothetical protein